MPVTNATRIVVTGSEGRMGRHLRRALAGHGTIVPLDRARGHDLLERDGDWTSLVAGADAVVHLAAPTTSGTGTFDLAARDNTLVTLHVIEAAIAHRVPRFVYASSVWADQDSWGLHPHRTYYAAGKQAGEAFLRAWAETTGGTAICLRFGFYDPSVSDAGLPGETHRLTEAGLTYWVEQALATEAPGRCLIWNALGRI